MTGMELAKIGYEAYCTATGGKSAVTGCDLPKFEDTPQTVKDAWIAAGLAIQEACDGA